MVELIEVSKEEFLYPGGGGVSALYLHPPFCDRYERVPDRWSESTV